MAIKPIRRVVTGNDARGRHRFSALEDGADQLIATLVIAHLSGIGRAQEHAAALVRNRQHVELFPLSDPTKGLRRLAGFAGQQPVHQQDAIGREPHHVVDGSQAVQEDLTCGIEVGMDFGLGLRHHAAADDAHADDAESHAGEEDDEQKAQHELRCDRQPPEV